MWDFLKRLFNAAPQAAPPPPPPPPPATGKPPVPEDDSSAFLDWLRAQRRPAIALVPDRERPVEARGSRLFGPAFLIDGEQWPVGKDGRTLDFLAQIDLADCAPLGGYPKDGIVQFFIGRDDLFGADFDELRNGEYLVRRIAPDEPGALHPIPHEEEFDTSGIDDYSPSCDYAMRKRGVALVAEPFTDRMDLSHHEASSRFFELAQRHDVSSLYAPVDAIEQERGVRHHTGGYPAFVQSDIRANPLYADYDHVLLRLTSDDLLMWGDVGECVFMIRSDDLSKGDFDEVVYSWDCS